MIVRPIKLVYVANARSKVCEPQSIAFYLLYSKGANDELIA